MVSLCHQYSQTSLYICAILLDSVLRAEQLQALILISLKTIIDSAKNWRWIIPFKKFSRVSIKFEMLLYLVNVLWIKGVILVCLGSLNDINIFTDYFCKLQQEKCHLCYAIRLNLSIFFHCLHLGYSEARYCVLWWRFTTQILQLHERYVTSRFSSSHGNFFRGKWH